MTIATRISPTELVPDDVAEPGPILSAVDGMLRRNGVAHSIYSGSLHYFRVHPEYWRDRLLRLRDMGLNCVDTYVPWNFHRPVENRPADFSGWRDLPRFLSEAQDVGLDVIFRPSPYMCAEWSNGGLPAWLTGRGVSPRSSDPGYLAPVETWLRDLIPRVAPFQAAHGGPIIAVQVENEYGSFGDDTGYLQWLDALLVELGMVEFRYTADGPTELMQDGGSIPGLFASVTLGSKPLAAKRLLESRQPGSPFFVAEFWNGWFDHWGQVHHVRDADEVGRTLTDIVTAGDSVSIYMAHGGSNFGLWAGANEVDGELRAVTTSYDSDAPIAEDGTLTAKFHAIRSTLGADATPPESRAPRLLDERSIPLVTGPALSDALSVIASRPTEHPVPRSFEQLGIDFGMVVYEADAVIPPGEVQLTFGRVADRGIVYLDGREAGVIEGSGKISVTGTGRAVRVRVVVENLGRINYGPRLGELKGLLGPVLVDRRMIHNWRSTPIGVQDADVAGWERLTARADSAQAGVSWARFDVDSPLDTHLRLDGFEKSFVWVNGFLLGRHWSVGPQRTLYTPAPLLQRGENVVTILELHRSGGSLSLVGRPDLGPAEPYIEEF